MTERPISFSAEMIRAILTGPKTMTRRVVAPGNSFFGSAPRRYWLHADFSRASVDGVGSDSWYLHVPAHDPCADCRQWGWDGTSHRLYPAFAPAHEWDQKPEKDYTPPASRLWVREAGWEPKEPTARELRDGADTWPKYRYDADGYYPGEADDFRAWGWKRRPAIHMPRWASRITLEVTAVRVERLQEISEDDARAEGVANCNEPGHGYCFHQSVGHRCSFNRLWNSINAKRGFGWDANPWVWVLTFRVIQPAQASADPPAPLEESHR